MNPTTEQHRNRHKLLHRHLDELFADYILHHPEEKHFTMMPLIKLIDWSFSQTKESTELPDENTNRSNT